MDFLIGAIKQVVFFLFVCFFKQPNLILSELQEGRSPPSYDSHNVEQKKTRGVHDTLIKTNVFC